MSGYLTGEAWLSNTSLQSFYDIGHEVASLVPEPAATALIIASVCAVCTPTRRRRPWRARDDAKRRVPFPLVQSPCRRFSCRPECLPSGGCSL